MRAIVVPLLILATSAGASAQDTLPPSEGGRVRSLGLPRQRAPYGGLSVGLSRAADAHLAVHGRVGSERDLTLPTTGILGVGVEAYLGAEGVTVDGGVRALLQSRLLRLGVGLDYNVRADRLGVLFSYTAPVRRGGVIGHGSLMRLDVVRTDNTSFHLGVNYPIAQRNRGSTRPPRDHVVLRGDRLVPLPFTVADPALDTAIGLVREQAHWVYRLAMPPLRRPGATARNGANARLAAVMARLTDGRTPDDETTRYHRAIDRAFIIATGDSTVGVQVSARARAGLLRDVLFPYNRLLGQKKRDDTTREFAVRARGTFARWLTTSSEVPPERLHVALYAMQQILDIVEEIRAEMLREAEDPRLGWLPLQLALAPDDYDEQTELDSIIGEAVGKPIVDGNRIWYVHNQRFQIELIESIAAAEEYHVLWIHDFAGLNASGQPDRLSLYTIHQAYLAALRDRVARYDSTGVLPVYMLFLDQHYFDKNRSRPFLTLLGDPLHHRLDLPDAFDALEAEVRAAQESLRRAVDASRLLSAERVQYGEGWLRNLVKVHVSVTNPADPSFRSPWVLPWIGLPDDAMRDHRKIVVWDVSEADPYRGKAMYAGAGVGEHYVGTSWEDRAVMLQGPAARTVRDEARALLESQGIVGGDVPHVLRPKRQPPDYDLRVQAEIDSMNAWGGATTRAVELHNGTGYAWKSLTVAKAVLFNLIAPGSVVKIPDSLWLSEFYARLLGGGALRGARVIIIAPSLASAPSRGPPQLAVAHELLSRIVATEAAIAAGLGRSGGAFRLGLYDPESKVDDLQARVDELRRSMSISPFLRDLYGFAPSVLAVLDSAELLLGPLPASRQLPVAEDSGRRPKLHFKGFLYISGEAWSRLIGGEPMAAGLREYLRMRGEQLRGTPGVSEEVIAAAMQRAGARVINPLLDRLCPDELDRWAFFLLVGSANQNYRSMLMDGEAGVLVSGWTSLYAVPDFLLLAGLMTWITSQEELDRLLPRPGPLQRWVGRTVKMGL